jgi:hypothetical protein
MLAAEADISRSGALFDSRIKNQFQGPFSELLGKIRPKLLRRELDFAKTP